MCPHSAHITLAVMALKELPSSRKRPLEGGDDGGGGSAALSGITDDAADPEPAAELDGEEGGALPSLSAAAAALQSLGPVLHQRGLKRPVTLPLGGLSTFNNKVLYLDVRAGAELTHLLELRRLVHDHFCEAGLMQPDLEFTPHVTVAKLSKLKGARGAPRHIPVEAYMELEQLECGCVEACEVQLCRMMGRREGAYYDVAARLSLREGG